MSKRFELVIIQMRRIDVFNQALQVALRGEISPENAVLDRVLAHAFRQALL